MRLRDLLYDGAFVTGTAREALADTVSRLAQSPELLYRSHRVVDLLVDTWPLGALIDDARQRWTGGPDARALAALERAAELAGTTLGWPTTVDRRWPLPDEQAIRDLAGPGPHEVVGRGERDGAPAVAVALGAPLVGREPVSLPPVIAVQGDEIAARRADLVARLQRGEGVAVMPLSPVPWDPASQAALAAFREVAQAQRAFERYGQAGLLVDELVTFDDLLSDAPSQRLGDRIERTCSVLVLPHLDDEGHIEGVGVLVWDAPLRPVRLVPGVAALLAQLDAPTSIDELAASVGLERRELTRILEQLAELGAVRAA